MRSREGGGMSSDGRRRTESSKRFEGAGGRELAEDERDELEKLIRGLVAERDAVKECMGWCVSRASSSSEIVDTITQVIAVPTRASNPSKPC